MQKDIFATMLSNANSDAVPQASPDHVLPIVISPPSATQRRKPVNSNVEMQALCTATMDEFLVPLGHWTTLGGLVMLGGFGLTVAFTAIAPYTVVVKAPAMVRPSGELRLVQAAVDGAIQQIKIQENQVVTQGEILATINASQLGIKESQLRGSAQQNQLQLKQISTQLKALETKIAAEATAMQRTISSAQSSLSGSKREHHDQQIITQAAVQEAKSNLDLAREEFNQYKYLSSTGAVAQLQIKQKEAALEAAQARLQQSQSGLNPSNSNVEIAQEKIVQVQAQGESTLATLRQEREELIRRQIELQNQINIDQKELQQVALQQQKSVIRAPASGTILKLELRNTGQVVRSGDAIAQIAPSQSPFVIKAHVLAQDIANVKICQAANISTCTIGKVFLRISAYPYPDYGVLIGAVRAVTPDAISSDIKDKSVVSPFYEVTIQPEKRYLERNQQRYPIKAGMDVSAEIIVQQETILSFILRKARLLANF